MQIQGAVALVTGANRGLGQAFAKELVARGATTVYGAARDPGKVTEPGVVPIRLDITDADEIGAAAERCQDVNLLVNNAGILLAGTLMTMPNLDQARAEMEVNCFGTLAMCRAFAPLLAANCGGAIVNMLSVTSWFTPATNGSYAVSKAAEWAVTNGIRIELAPQGTLVVGVHSSFIDTEMAAGVDLPKITPEDVARQVFDGVEADVVEVIVDDRSRMVKASLPNDHELIYPAMQAVWDATLAARTER